MQPAKKNNPELKLRLDSFTAECLGYPAYMVMLEGEDDLQDFQMALKNLNDPKALVVIKTAMDAAKLDFAKLIENSITFGKQNPENKPVTETIYESQPEDEQTCLDIVERSVTQSRMQNDSQIPSGAGQLFNRHWIENCFKGRASKIYVWKANPDSKATGFCALIEKSDHVVVDYIAVDSDHQGKGIGGTLMQAAESYAASLKKLLYVTTQQKNEKACGLYKSLGFDIKTRLNCFHLHIGQ